MVSSKETRTTRSKAGYTPSRRPTCTRNDNHNTLKEPPQLLSLKILRERRERKSTILFVWITKEEVISYKEISYYHQRMNITKLAVNGLAKITSVFLNLKCGYPWPCIDPRNDSIYIHITVDRKTERQFAIESNLVKLTKVTM
ncbi:hypothetical protein YC2023_070091 [Brassica napus]